ncbi:hypothetical protein PtB15_1B575 [Puccinia triticina]|nr:hypothetical protein PtB15_1B575 [Puccinia triticina]
MNSSSPALVIVCHSPLSQAQKPGASSRNPVLSSPNTQERVSSWYVQSAALALGHSVILASLKDHPLPPRPGIRQKILCQRTRIKLMTQLHTSKET